MRVSCYFKYLDHRDKIFHGPQNSHGFVQGIDT